VKLNQRTCTCLEWQHTGKPCQHVLAFISSQRGLDLNNLCMSTTQWIGSGLLTVDRQNIMAICGTTICC
jgi:hypothetical protein